MRAPIFALALDDIAEPNIESHVENTTHSAIDTTECFVRKATLLLIKVFA